MATSVPIIVFALITHNVPYMCEAPGTEGAAVSGICSSTPEKPGTGLTDTGNGLVHIMQSGFYTFYGAIVGNVQPGKSHYWEAGRYVTIVATSSKPMWSRPGGVYEVIPRTLLYPPYSRTQ